jgi:CBS domain-containing protein
MRCEEIMTRDPKIATPETSIARCSELMRDHGIGFLPLISESGVVKGVVTDRDLVIRGIAEGLGATTPVSEVMSKNVIYCYAGEDLTIAEARMAKSHRSRLVVVDELGRCVGVISIDDVARVEEAMRAGKVLAGVTKREAQN